MDFKDYLSEAKPDGKGRTDSITAMIMDLVESKGKGLKNVKMISKPDYNSTTTWGGKFTWEVEK